MQDVLQVCGALTAEQNAQSKIMLDRIVAMLTKLGQRGYAIHVEAGEYRTSPDDTDSETDPDSDGNHEPTIKGIAEARDEPPAMPPG